MVELTQADREAVKRHQQRFLTEGESETTLLLEAFARHRIAAAQAECAAVVAYLRSQGDNDAADAFEAGEHRA